VARWHMVRLRPPAQPALRGHASRACTASDACGLLWPCCTPAQQESVPSGRCTRAGTAQRSPARPLEVRTPLPESLIPESMLWAMLPGFTHCFTPTVTLTATPKYRTTANSRKYQNNGNLGVPQMEQSLSYVSEFGFLILAVTWK
jgi:hypothetical protein